MLTIKQTNKWRNGLKYQYGFLYCCFHYYCSSWPTMFHLWDTHISSLVNNNSNSLIAWARGISPVMTDQFGFAISSPLQSFPFLPPFLSSLFLFLFSLLTNLISIAWIKELGNFALGLQDVFLSQLLPALLFSLWMSAHISMLLAKIAP